MLQQGGTEEGFGAPAIELFALVLASPTAKAIFWGITQAAKEWVPDYLHAMLYVYIHSLRPRQSKGLSEKSDFYRPCTQSSPPLPPVPFEPPSNENSRL